MGAGEVDRTWTELGVDSLGDPVTRRGYRLAHPARRSLACTAATAT